MRIITGFARGIKLKTLPGEDTTRPTAEMVKEGIFSALQFDLADRKVLELFGGCGQLSLEALSRGAESAVIVDNSREACDIIRENANKTKLADKCIVINSDRKDFLKNQKGRAEKKYSLLIMDPPYNLKCADETIALALENNLLTDDAIIVTETLAEGVPEPVEGFTAKSYRYGKTFVTIMRRESK